MLKFLPVALSNRATLSFLHLLLYDAGAQYNTLHNHLALCGQNSPNTVGWRGIEQCDIYCRIRGKRHYHSFLITFLNILNQIAQHNNWLDPLKNSDTAIVLKKKIKRVKRLHITDSNDLLFSDETQLNGSF